MCVQKRGSDLQDLGMESVWRPGSGEPGMPPACQLGDKMITQVTNGKYQRRCQLGEI